jgi:nucleoside triphosphate diphosphatase
MKSSDAIERADMADLRGELGDLLLQVVFHARIAEEAGHFAFADVARSIADKMESRHPHIFGDQTGSMGEMRWENLKQAEREAAGATSALDGVAGALPGLMRAQKLQKRAARVGFDWPDREGPKAKIIEEIDELEEASSDSREEEAGDLLFAAVNLVRAYGIDAEAALRAANVKFERRFRAMEDPCAGARVRGPDAGPAGSALASGQAATRRAALKARKTFRIPSASTAPTATAPAPRQDRRSFPR